MNASAISPTHLKDAVTAILICVTGWLCFSICDALSKWFGQTYSVAQIILMSSLPVTVVSAGYLGIKYGRAGFKTNDLKWHMARAGTVILTAIFAVNAVRNLPLADFYGITFLAPFVAAIMASFFLKEHIGSHRMIAIICGFIGVLVIAQPQFATYSIGLLYALGCTLCLSATSIILRKMKGKDPVLLFAFFPSLANCIVQAPLAAQDFIIPHGIDIALFALLAASVMGGLLLISTGLRRAPAYAVVAPFQYSQIIWGISIGYLVFGDIPTPMTLIGIVIIVTSGIYMIWREYQVHGGKNGDSKTPRKLRILGRSQKM